MNYTEKCREISGFGGDYEQSCRKMVIAGYEYLMQPGIETPIFSGYKGVFGITLSENESARELQEAMNKASGNKCTGAMMHACTNHVLKAKAVGWEEYIRLMEQEQ